LKNLSSADHQKGLLMMISAIEGDVVRDAIDDDGVGRSFVEKDCAGLDEFGGDAVHIEGVDALDQGPGKAVLHAE
jgi:hypothetical protein